jgi:hypothetical protein
VLARGPVEESALMLDKGNVCETKTPKRNKRLFAHELVHVEHNLQRRSRLRWQGDIQPFCIVSAQVDHLALVDSDCAALAEW